MKLALASSLVLLLSTTAFADELLVVSPSGPYTSISEAMTFASDGDVIHVKAGVYKGFRVTDRSVAILAATPGTVEITSTILVSEISGPVGVTLYGLSVQGRHGPALDLTSSTGPIRVLRCSLHGDRGPILLPDPHIEEVFAGVRAVSVDDLRLQDCDLHGAHGMPDGAPYSVDGLWGAPGATLVQSRVRLNQCVAEGGSGSDFTTHPGGAGAALTASRLVAAGSTFQGGNGALPFAGHYCGSHNPRAGDGGDGLSLQEGSVVRLRDSLLLPGTSGPWYGWGDVCSEQAGQDGVPTNDPASVTFQSGVATSVVWEPMAPSESTLLFDVEGRPGDALWVLTSLAGQRPWSPGIEGSVLATGPHLRPLSQPLGVIPSSGSVSMRMELPSIARDEFLWLHAQIVVVSPTGQRSSGPAGAIVVHGVDLP
ncbi:hypothetical protein Poly30_33440 [Planctomycetes bacterium Poly30]|uniref:Right handed beta helix domain-containing protein n=1 Tax=Saltatorellus ferox TaxID=2528018 RepID=A0A518EUR9_9BACT|nr:hypothetical protein Poly30_33440 [Planctomycetes bacterium Poly30]